MKTSTAAVNVTRILKNVPVVMATAAGLNGATKKARITDERTRGSTSHGLRPIVRMIPASLGHGTTAVLTPMSYVAPAVEICVDGKITVRKRQNLSGWMLPLRTPAVLPKPKKTFNDGKSE
jgi:hypothetical protein